MCHILFFSKQKYTLTRTLTFTHISIYFIRTKLVVARVHLRAYIRYIYTYTCSRVTSFKKTEPEQQQKWKHKHNSNQKNEKGGLAPHFDRSKGMTLITQWLTGHSYVWGAPVRRVPGPLARGSSGPGKFLHTTGYLDDFLEGKNDLSVCFSVHIINVKPAKKDGFYDMDAYGCKETWHWLQLMMLCVNVVCFINIIKQKHIICRQAENFWDFQYLKANS